MMLRERMRAESKRRLLATAAACAIGFAVAGSAGAANVTIMNIDDPGVGFNDNTSVSPVGGNPGTTLGQQRLNVFEYAAAIWGSRLTQPAGGGGNLNSLEHGDVGLDIVIEATFDSITDGGGNPLCNQFQGVLGAAGADNFYANFGAGLSNTWYHSALADHISGSDRASGSPDVFAIFNADVDETFCLGTRGWYYGLDGNAGQDIELVSVVIHEIGHGLGFSTIVNLGGGQKANGWNDAYMLFLEDHSTGKLYPNMTDGERVVASTDTGDLHWTGTTVTDFVEANSLVTGDFLVNGFDPISNHIEMYAPSPQEPGSSVSHYSTAVSPNEIMEPSLTQPIHNLELTLALFADIGWSDIIQCGDADRNGTRAATDALIALQTSVSAGNCLESLCDPNGSGTITATDALVMLQGGVGQEVTYNCGLAGS